MKGKDRCGDTRGYACDRWTLELREAMCHEMGSKLDSAAG